MLGGIVSTRLFASIKRVLSTGRLDFVYGSHGCDFGQRDGEEPQEVGWTARLGTHVYASSEDKLDLQADR